MAKTKPIGVRFNEEILNGTGLSPQKALNRYEEVYLTKLNEKVIDDIEKRFVNDGESLRKLATDVSDGISTQKQFDAERVKDLRKDEFPQYVDPNTQEIAKLEKELAEIPDKTKGMGKKWASVLQTKIDRLKA